MNIFLIGLNCQDYQIPKILSELLQLKELFPELDPNTLWSFKQNNYLFTANIHTSRHLIEPRVYVKETEQEILLFDGCMINPKGDFNVYNLEELNQHWHSLKDILEGQFVIARIHKNLESSLEIINDPLGMYQVYYLKQGNQWFISNSVYLLKRIGQVSKFDSLGISLYLTWGWASSDRTLREGIQVLPSGQHWQWRKGHIEPQKQKYFQRAWLSQIPQTDLTSQQQIQSLTHDLEQMMKALTSSFGASVYCPLTAGRDSRLLASLLIKNNIDAEFFSLVTSEAIDVEIARKIAEQFKLKWTVIQEKNEQNLQSWLESAQKWIAKRDGLISIRQFRPNDQAVDNQLGVVLNGGGGEIARAYYSNAKFFLHKKDFDYVYRYLNDAKLTWRRHDLLQDEIVQTAAKYLKCFIKTLLEEGFKLVDIPCVLYTYERVRRWAGSNCSLHPGHISFAPLCTRPFIKAAYSIPAKQRYTEPLHYRILSLSPELCNIPFETTWKIQQSTVNCWYEIIKNSLDYRLGRKIRPRNKTIHRADSETAQLIENKRIYLRDYCLDHINSPIWDFVKRSAFEKNIPKQITTPTQRQFTGMLWDIATLFLLSE
ncbi:hypothetical protein Lepto7375DRAFT_2563 [Leptolyngbya sp. PCC 7375]|nr:hypothetical protein Lepto7375DRAFT_2563 [Leptolyngbya sp. PCC 7375]